MTGQAVQTAPINPLSATVGVLIHPVVTMREIAAARPWLLASIVSVTISLLSALASLGAPPTTQSIAPPTAGTPGWVVAFYNASANYANLTRSAAGLIVTPVTGLVFLCAWAGALYGIGYALGGRGRFSALFSTISFATVPWILYLPLQVWLPAGTALSSAARDAFFVWTLILDTLAIRVALGLSTARAVGVIALTFVGPGLLLLLVVLLLASLGAALPLLVGMVIVAAILVGVAMRLTARTRRV